MWKENSSAHGNNASESFDILRERMRERVSEEGGVDLKVGES